MINVELSIIVPVYNSEKFLDKCINSILKQSYSNFELILVNDASTDLSGEICDSFALRDKRVKVIHHKENRGLSISREDGFLQSNGKWISFVDNDDYLSPFMYECLMNEKDKGNIVCIRGEDKSNEEIEEAVWRRNDSDARVISGKDFCSEVYGKKGDYGCIGPIWAKIIKREMIEQTLSRVSKYKEELFWVYFEDVLFVPMLFYYSDYVVFINQLNYMHRHIKSNLSSTLIPSEYHYETIYAKKIILQLLLEWGLQQAYDVYLMDCLLEVQSTWYKVWKNESDEKKKSEFNKYVEKYYEEYYEEINKQRESLDIKKIVKRISINVFMKDRYLWGKTIGNIYFHIIRKFLY